MADGEVKQMSTIIFFATSSDGFTKSIETLVEALRADGRCDHKIAFRPITQNFFQIIRGVHVDDDPTKPMLPIGNHEILYLPASREEEIARLERTKNVVLTINGMCIVGDNDEKQYKIKKLIDWLLEEREEITL